MSNINWKSKKTVFIAATMATAFWGSAYPCIKAGYELFSIAADDIGGKLVFAGYRFALAGVMVLMMFLLTERPKEITSSAKVSGEKQGIMSVILSFTLLGLMQTTFQYVFFYIGLANTTGAKGSIINSSGAFFGVLLAPLFYRSDKVTIKKIIGCVVGFAGIIILNFDGSSLGGFVMYGEGFVLISSLLATLASFYSKAIVKKWNVFLTTGSQLFIGGLILLVIGYGMGGVIVFTVKGFILLVYMAIISAVGFSLWTMLLKYNPASEVTIYNLFIPVFGNMLSGIFLGENIFTLINILAIICVSLGIVFVNLGDREDMTNNCDDTRVKNIRQIIDEARHYVEENYICLIEEMPDGDLSRCECDASFEGFKLPGRDDRKLSSARFGSPVHVAKETLPDEDMHIAEPYQMPSIDSVLPEIELKETFSEMLLREIDESGAKDSDVYKRAMVDRRLFSKIRSTADYIPSKRTAVAFALALNMDIKTAETLLMKGGYALSDSNRFDLVIRFCLEKGIYNIMDVNEILSEFDLPLLG